MNVANELRLFREDKTSGATALAERAIDMFDAFITDQRARPTADFAQSIAAVARDIVNAQPSMSIMVELARVVIESASDGSDAQESDRAREALASFRQDVRTAMCRICEMAVSILPQDSTVLTYSNSTTVTQALLYAASSGHLGRVILSEARPAYDGRSQARTLMTAGVQVDYCVDMGLFSLLNEADLVLVGADAMFPEHFVNKIGTRALAGVATAEGVPCYCLCVTNKFLPSAAIDLVRVVDHERDEVWSASPPPIRIVNRYFENISLSLVTGVITEKGVLDPASIRDELKARRLPDALLQLGATA
jgi:translation initiation factor 2B subunit (eIF-2B alpha/beta/delta family)